MARAWAAVLCAGLMVATVASARPAAAVHRPQARANVSAVPSVYQRWLAAEAGRPAAVGRFEQFLARRGVGGILPADQLLRSASSWQACGAAFPYDLPPESDWPHIVATLQFIRARITPAIGKVAAVSGYRSPELGKCAGGAPQSAHGGYYALDLVPLRAFDRAAMIGTLCALHKRYGARYDVGLGFYTGLRFHVDTKAARLWGADYHMATSPCVTGVVDPPAVVAPK